MAQKPTVINKIEYDRVWHHRCLRRVEFPLAGKPATSLYCTVDDTRGTKGWIPVVWDASLLALVGAKRRSDKDERPKSREEEILDEVLAEAMAHRKGKKTRRQHRVVKLFYCQMPGRPGLPARTMVRRAQAVEFIRRCRKGLGARFERWWDQTMAPAMTAWWCAEEARARTPVNNADLLAQAGVPQEGDAERVRELGAERDELRARVTALTIEMVQVKADARRAVEDERRRWVDARASVPHEGQPRTAEQEAQLREVERCFRTYVKSAAVGGCDDEELDRLRELMFLHAARRCYSNYKLTLEKMVGEGPVKDPINHFVAKGLLEPFVVFCREWIAERRAAERRPPDPRFRAPTPPELRQARAACTILPSDN